MHPLDFRATGLRRQHRLGLGQPAGWPSCPTYQNAAPGETGFASETATATGISKRSINRSVSRVEAIPGDIRAIIKGTKLDTGTYLDSLKGMEPDEQRAKPSP